MYTREFPDQSAAAFVARVRARYLRDVLAHPRFRSLSFVEETGRWEVAIAGKARPFRGRTWETAVQGAHRELCAAVEVLA